MSLGHSTEQAYARSDLYERRRMLMQEWADYVVGDSGGEQLSRSYVDWVLINGTSDVGASNLGQLLNSLLRSECLGLRQLPNRPEDSQAYGLLHRRLGRLRSSRRRDCSRGPVLRYSQVRSMRRTFCPMALGNVGWFESP